jgi:hypothetical protein
LGCFLFYLSTTDPLQFIAHTTSLSSMIAKIFQYRIYNMFFPISHSVLFFPASEVSFVVSFLPRSLSHHYYCCHPKKQHPSPSSLCKYFTQVVSKCHHHHHHHYHHHHHHHQQQQYLFNTIWRHFNDWCFDLHLVLLLVIL